MNFLACCFAGSNWYPALLLTNINHAIIAILVIFGAKSTNDKISSCFWANHEELSIRNPKNTVQNQSIGKRSYVGQVFDRVVLPKVASTVSCLPWCRHFGTYLSGGFNYFHVHPFGFDPQTNHDHMPSPCHRGDLRVGRGGGKVREESGAIWAKQSGEKKAQNVPQKSQKFITRWWQLKCFFSFHPYLGKWSNFD